MDITLINDLLLIRPLADPEPTTAWGFVLPPTDEHANTPLRGLVLATGPGRRPRLARASRDLVNALDAILEIARISGWTSPIWRTAHDALAAHRGLPERIPMHVRVGDTVIYSPHGYQAYRIDGEDLIVTQEASVLGVI